MPAQLTQIVTLSVRRAEWVDTHPGGSNCCSQLPLNLRPDHLVNVEVRFARSDLNHGCSELPLEGYVQSKIQLEEYIMHRWFSAAWSPVGGRCNCSDAYRSFRAPHPDYIRLSLYGEAALNKGGRPKKLKEVPLPSFLTKIASHPTKHLASASYKIHMLRGNLRPSYFTLTLGGIFS